MKPAGLIAKFSSFLLIKHLSDKKIGFFLGNSFQTIFSSELFIRADWQKDSSQFHAREIVKKIKRKKISNHSTKVEVGVHS